MLSSTPSSSPTDAMASGLTTFNSASQILPMKPSLFSNSKPNITIRCTTFAPSSTKNAQTTQSVDSVIQTRRTALLGLVAWTASTQLSGGPSLAEEGPNNGFWLTGPLPIPSVTNKIANEETGTRSFLKKGVYVANIGVQGSAYRLRQYAFDLVGLADLMGQDAWSYISKYLCLKTTVMYYDFDKVISAAPPDQKPALTDLANKLFDNVEKLEEAVKKQSMPETESCFAETTTLLGEVMTRMA
ncbi:hypothetical protein QJS10_CPA01g01033 [Acorus calamus]|uniref:Photosynthetic NDH subcomplex L 3 n=1 Tax=Acorus calamus TaxID=4465 RepID=A0AAV9FHR7_ACOCL|nr:hypothetical protein QJS10_CPA01g01033 [Acorus calamus]